VEPNTTNLNVSDELTEDQQEQVTGGAGGAGSVVGIDFSVQAHGHGGNGGNGGAGGTSPIGTSGL
jgi:hypothetical protein